MRERQENVQKNTPLTEALFYILLSVRKPNHGYGIVQEVEKLTEGRVVLGPGTLYGAVQTMTAKGWIRVFSAETDSRKNILLRIWEERYLRKRKSVWKSCLEMQQSWRGEGNGKISTGFEQ